MQTSVQRLLLCFGQWDRRCPGWWSSLVFQTPVTISPGPAHPCFLGSQKEEPRVTWLPAEQQVTSGAQRKSEEEDEDQTRQGHKAVGSSGGLGAVHPVEWRKEGCGCHLKERQEVPGLVARLPQRGREALGPTRDLMAVEQPPAVMDKF